MTHAIVDSATMLRRQFRHMQRFPAVTLTIVGTPVVFLLLFVYVFGGMLGDGLGGAGGRAEYVNYVAPGIVVMTVAMSAQGTTIGVATDMAEGIVNRFRTMAIARVSVLTGHVLGSLIQALASMAVVLGVAVLVGFRPAAGLGNWLGVLGVLAMIVFAFTWLAVALGMVTKNVAAASNLPLPLMILPMMGSGFVPTDSMPLGLRWFAEYQPFTPLIETLRGLLMDRPVGDSVWQAVAWSAVICVGGYLWARKLYNREPS